jgi:hypothetical protein
MGADASLSPPGFGSNYDIKRTKNSYSSLSFGLYNAYNRKNAYLIDFREKKDNPMSPRFIG